MKVNLQATQKTKDKYERDSDNLIQTLKSKTPQEAADFVKANISDGTITRDDVLEKLVKIVTYILRNS